MSILAYGLLFVLSLLVQLKIVPLFSINETTPDLILIVVIAVAFRKGQLWGALSGCVVGLFWDVLGTEFVGLSALCKAIAGYTAGFFAHEQVERSFGTLVGLLIMTILIHDFVYYSIMSIGLSMNWWQMFFRYILFKTTYTFVIALAIHLAWPTGLWGHARRFE
ncbi:MAG: rod shape-determining protein MreD [bacterium]